MDHFDIIFFDLLFFGAQIDTLLLLVTIRDDLNIHIDISLLIWKLLQVLLLFCLISLDNKSIVGSLVLDLAFLLG